MTTETKKVVEKLSLKERQYITALSKLALQFGISPREAVILWGVMARGMVEFEQRSGTPELKAAEKLLELFCCGFGGVTDIKVGATDERTKH